MSESAGIDSFFGASDAEALFRRLACPSDSRGGDRCLAARGGRTLWNQPQRGGDLGAAFRGDRQRCSKAKRRQHLAAGAARGVSAGSDCQPAGPDAGRDRRGDAQTPDRRQPQRGVAVLRSPQHQLQKKTLYAAEQKRADVARARRRWMREQGATKLGNEADKLGTGDPDLLAHMIREELDQAEGKPDRLLLYIDQWEELYTQPGSSSDGERAARYAADVNRFIDLLLNASRSAPVTIVGTVRADFYDPL